MIGHVLQYSTAALKFPIAAAGLSVSRTRWSRAGRCRAVGPRDRTGRRRRWADQTRQRQKGRRELEPAPIGPACWGSYHTRGPPFSLASWGPYQAKPTLVSLSLLSLSLSLTHTQKKMTLSPPPPLSQCLSLSLPSPKFAHRCLAPPPMHRMPTGPEPAAATRDAAAQARDGRTPSD